MLRPSSMAFRYYLLLLAGSFLGADLVLAGDQVSQPAIDEQMADGYSHKSSRNRRAVISYVVETSDESASESLDRISGDVDLGFSAPENTFKSTDHYGVGPFAKEEAEMRKGNDPQD